MLFTLRQAQGERFYWTGIWNSYLNAKELDKKFGMPLNKTLILLRNKDVGMHSVVTR